MSSLHAAAISGNLYEIQRLIAEGVDIDCRDETTGATPLITSCLSTHAGLDIMEILLAHGADIHARAIRFSNEEEPLIAFAVTSSQVSHEKIRFLLERGAEVNYRSPRGYTLLTWAACDDRPELIDLLLLHGATLDGESSYKESALSVLSRQGRFEEINKLLTRGADPLPLKWTTLHRMIALGTLEEVRRTMAEGTDLEAVDFWERTAFLLSIQAGDIEKASLLLASGANRYATGRCGKLPMQYPIDRDDGRMMQWLIKAGFGLTQENQPGNFLLIESIEGGAIACFHVLIAAGVDWREKDSHGDSSIHCATDLEIIETLIELGADAAELEVGSLRKWIKLETFDALLVSEEEFLKNRTRRFGTANPERMGVPFWSAMVRNGWSGFRAAKHFSEDSYRRESPVWCYDRLGMSLTQLADGRFIQIAGEHEDSYDPDFCIYNDVIVHDGKGGFEILGYPEDVFPPTDFHSATLVGEWIYIIGNLGCQRTAEADAHQTPIYRFDTVSGKVERVSTTGISPGWIHRHNAELIDRGIRISGGKRYCIDENGQGQIREHTATLLFDLDSGCWELVNT